MYWVNNHASSPHIETVLLKEDLTLEELFNEESLIQELKSLNKKLIDFLTRPDILEELVTYITTEPSADLDERERYKYANLACELLTTDIPHLSEKLMGDEELLLKLYSFLESEPPLNPLLASFFSRTMGMFLTRRQEQNWYSYQLTCLKVLEFLRNKETCIPLLIKHLGTLAVMDLTLKLATQVEDDEMRVRIIDWLDKQKLIELVVELLDPSVDSDRHSSASQLLCDIIMGSRDALMNSDSKCEPNIILKTIESPKTVVKLLDLILKGEKCESSIVGGIMVLLTLLEPTNSREVCKNFDTMSMYGSSIATNDGGRGDEDTNNACNSSTPTSSEVTLIEAIIPYLPTLHDLLINPPKKPSLKMTCGVVDPPFGKTRLHVAKLLVALIATHNPNINQSFSELGTIGVLLDLFFKYTWNNFLHTQVEKCLSFAISCDLLNCEEISKENVLLHDVFVTCNLLQRIVDTWNENDNEQKQPGGCRRGYMGHLFRIAMNIESQRDRLKDFLKRWVSEECLQSWDDFVANTLTPLDKIQSTCLGGGEHPGRASTQDNKDYSDTLISQYANAQQLYNDYLKQSMAERLPDTFGYDEAEFNEPDESLNPSVDQMSSPFEMQGRGGGGEDSEQDRREALFEQFCAQKVHTLDDDEEEGGEEGDSDDDGGDAARDEDGNAQWAWNGDSAANFGTADGIERPGPEGREEGGGGMELDQWMLNNNRSTAPWSTSTVIPPQDPWANTPVNSSTDEEGWANFDAQFDTAASDGFTSDNRSEPTGSVAFQSESTGNTLLNSPSDSFSGIIAASVGLPEGGSSSPSDNNANISSVSQNEPAESEMLMDNFRFLSGQGLMSTANGEIVPTEEKKDEAKDKEMNVESSKEEEKTEQQLVAQPEVEKVVVLATAAAATPSSNEPANQEPEEGTPPTTQPPPPITAAALESA